MSRFMRSVAAALGQKAAEALGAEDGRRAKKGFRRRVRRLRNGALYSLALLGAGFFLGVHRKEVLARLRRE